MRRALVVVVGAAALIAPPAGADTVVLAQHAAGSARASVARIDPRYAGNGFVEEIGPAHARVSTVGLHGRDAVSRAWAASQATGGAQADPFPSGVTAEQQAGATDNPTGVQGSLGLASADAHARAVDLAAGVCPAAVEGERVLATAGSSVADAGVAGLEVGSVTSRSTIAIEGSAMSSTASTSLGRIRVLDTYELRVLGELRLGLVATGEAGGASLSYEAPVVEVIDLSSGELVARVDATDPSVDLTPDESSFHGFSPVLNVRVGAPHDVIVMADGTFARAEADAVELRMFDPGGSFEWQHVRLGSLAVSVTAPQGGVRTCDGGDPPAVDRTVPRVLVYERTSGWEHTSIKQANLEIAEIANITGSFTLEVTDDPSFLRADKLAAIDAVYFNSTTGEFPWSAEQKDLFLDWLACDGGVVGTHAAADANYTWPAWEEIIGAAFASHPHVGYFPVVGDATVIVEDQTSPITEAWHGMPTFRWAEEYYQFEHDPRGTQDVHVLLSLDETSTYPTNPFLPRPFGGGYVDDQPLAWTKTFRGDGRVFYTAFGHNGFAWSKPDFRHHMLRGIEWVTDLRPVAGCLPGPGEW